MKKVVAKIWVPMLLVLTAAVQSFGIDAHRAVRLRGLADSLALTRIEDSTDTGIAVADSLTADSLTLDTLFLTARDTIKVPDSLQYTDPFFYKY